MIALYIVAGIIVLILVIAALVGTGWTFERSILINAPVSKVWIHISSLRTLNEWNPWMTKDPNIKTDYNGTDGTPGASFQWDSAVKNVGSGKQTITALTPQTEMVTRLDFYKPFKGTGDAFMRLEKKGENLTKASWKIISSTPYPMNFIKIFGVIEKNMDKDFTLGLSKLKQISEQAN